MTDSSGAFVRRPDFRAVTDGFADLLDRIDSEFASEIRAFVGHDTLKFFRVVLDLATAESADIAVESCPRTEPSDLFLLVIAATLAGDRDYIRFLEHELFSPEREIAQNQGLRCQ